MRKHGYILRAYILNNKAVTLSALLFGLLGTLTTVCIPLFIGAFYQQVFHSSSTRGHMFEAIFGTLRNTDTLFIYFLCLLGLRFLFQFMEQYALGLSGERCSNQLRIRLFTKHMRMEMSAFNKKAGNKYLLRYSGDMQAITNYLTKGILRFINDLLFLGMALVVLLALDVRLTLVVCGAIPVILLINLLLGKKLRAFAMSRRNIRSSNLAFVAERLFAVRSIKAYNRESPEIERFTKRSEKLYHAGRSYQAINALMQAAYQFFIYLALVGVLYYSVVETSSLSTHIDGAIITTYIMLLISVIPVYKRVLRIQPIWISGNISLGKLHTIFEQTEEYRDNENRIQITEGNIRLEQVAVQYGSTHIFSNLNAEIPANSITLLSGPAGSGKTSLLKVLCGLQKNAKGHIYFDNIPIQQMSPFYLRKNVALSSDDLPLIGTSFFEAVSYSRKEDKRPAAEKIMREMGIKKINGTKVSDRTLIEGGRNISAAERKLLLHARAILTRKKILLFDEPYVGLDGEGKIHMYSILKELSKKHTILVTDNTENAFTYDHIIIIPADH